MGAVDASQYPDNVSSGCAREKGEIYTPSIGLWLRKGPRDGDI